MRKSIFGRGEVLKWEPRPGSAFRDPPSAVVCLIRIPRLGLVDDFDENAQNQTDNSAAGLECGLARLLQMGVILCIKVTLISCGIIFIWEKLHIYDSCISILHSISVGRCVHPHPPMMV